jgi:hypothetical protein
VRVFSHTLLTIGLAREDGIAILIGNCGTQTVHSPIAVVDTAPLSSKFYLRTYNSERGAWEEGGVIAASELRGTALAIEAGGFRLLELSLVRS